MDGNKIEQSWVGAEHKFSPLLDSFSGFSCSVDSPGLARWRLVELGWGRPMPPGGWVWGGMTQSSTAFLCQRGVKPPCLLLPLGRRLGESTQGHLREGKKMMSETRRLIKHQKHDGKWKVLFAHSNISKAISLKLDTAQGYTNWSAHMYTHTPMYASSSES